MQINRNRKGVTIRCSVDEYHVLRAIEKSADNVTVEQKTKGASIALNKIGSLFPKIENLQETL